MSRIVLMLTVLVLLSSFKVWAFRDCPECPEMVEVPAGKFMMGSPHDEEHRAAQEGPRHQVTISKPFAVGKYEVTVGQFRTFVEEAGLDTSRGCRFRSSDRTWKLDEALSYDNHIFRQKDNEPVVCVGWEEARAYVEWLSNKTGKRYRLLSEAEWEYVARAGTSGPFHFGHTISTDQANYNGERTYGPFGRQGPYRGKTSPVGTFPANAFGLHDVHGNVAEWVEDCSTKANEDYNGASTDGSAFTLDRCTRRIGRGGSWWAGPAGIRSARRGRWVATRRYPTVGFRVALTLE